MATVHMSKGWIFAVVFVSALLLVNIGAVGYQYLDRPWNPLCQSSEGNVLNENVDKYPVVKFGDEVRIRAIKCNTTDKAIKVHTTRYWFSVDPLGASLEVTAREQQLPPGRQQVVEYSNVVPPSVIARTKAFRENQGKQVVWQLTGTDTPYDEDGDAGEQIIWKSEEFVVDYQ